MKYNCTLIGHRGFPQRFPENSLEGALAALDAGAGGVEVDVQLTADRVPIVLHDACLARTSGRDFGGPVHQLNFAHVRQASVHEPQRFAHKFFPTSLTTLKTFCEAYAKYNKPLFIELKSESLQAHGAEDYVSSVIEASRTLHRKNRILIAFSPVIAKVAKFRFDCVTGWILQRFDYASLVKASEIAPDILVCDIKKIPNLNLIQPRSWQWFIYDVVEPSVAQQCCQRGVRYVETWDVARLLAA